jgi:hypothetical protein
MERANRGLRNVGLQVLDIVKRKDVDELWTPPRTSIPRVSRATEATGTPGDARVLLGTASDR